MNIPTRKPDEVIEAEMGLAPVPKQDLSIATTSATQSTADARTESINSLLAAAYPKASTLQLTKEEQEKLVAPFDDADFRRGAGGKQDLLYIEHHALRNRLNTVLGVGQWTMIVRKQGSETFVSTNSKTKEKTENVRVYVEAVLLVRGCYVSEAIGEGNYFKNNASQSFGDAYESAKTNAFRRVCKELGIGLQAWSKDFCDEWMQRYPGFDRPVRKATVPVRK